MRERRVPGAGWSRIAAVLLAWAASGACLDPMDPGDVDIAAVRVTIGNDTAVVDTIQARGTTRVRAVALAREGFDIGLRTFRFTSSDSAVALVDAGGTVRGVAPGEAVITATTPQGLSGTVRVVVIPSTIAYRIDVSGVPGPIAFSADYSRAYVGLESAEIALVDALGFLRTGSIGLDAPAADLAAESSRLYAALPSRDVVQVIATATSSGAGAVSVGAEPRYAVSGGDRVFVSVVGDGRVVAIQGGAVVASTELAGRPRQLAISGDGQRLFVAVEGRGTWQIHVLSAATLEQLAVIFDLSAEPTALAATFDGRRAFALLPSRREVVVYAQTPGGAVSFASAGSVATGASPGGIGVRQVGIPYVVVSGEPTTIFHGETLVVSERIDGAGTGDVAIRPDGLFAFIGDPANRRVNVIGL